MRRHMYVRGALGVMLMAVGIISLNPLFLILSGVFLFSAYSIWRKEEDKNNGKGPKA